MTNLRNTSHSRCRTKQKATRTAWQRMAEQLPTMTILYHNVFLRTPRGLSVFAVLQPHCTRIPPDVSNVAAWLWTLFVSNTTKNHKNFIRLLTKPHPLTKLHTPPKNFKKILQHFVKYLTHTHKKTRQSAGINVGKCPTQGDVAWTATHQIYYPVA